MRAWRLGSLIQALVGGGGAVGGLLNRVGLVLKAAVRVVFRAAITVWVLPW